MPRNPGLVRRHTAWHLDWGQPFWKHAEPANCLGCARLRKTNHLLGQAPKRRYPTLNGTRCSIWTEVSFFGGLWKLPCAQAAFRYGVRWLQGNRPTCCAGHGMLLSSRLLSFRTAYCAKRNSASCVREPQSSPVALRPPLLVPCSQWAFSLLLTVIIMRPSHPLSQRHLSHILLVT